MSLDMSEKFQLLPVRIPNLFKQNVLKAVGRTQEEAVRCICERLVGKQIESCALGALQARSEEHLKHPDRWLLFEQLLFVPKHVTLPEKMRLAWLVSIPLALLTSSEVLSCAGGPVMSLDTLEKCHLLPERIPSFVEQNVLKAECQLVPVRIPSLFEQNVLKTVGRTQQGSCKVYAGKTTWKTNWKLYPWSLASKKWGALEAPWQMTPIGLLQSMWQCRRRWVCVASQHSILLFSKIYKQSLSISEHCKTTTHHTKSPKLIFLTLSRASCTCGHVDINWVTFMRSGGRHINSNLFQWEVPACLTEFLCWYIP